MTCGWCKGPLPERAPNRDASSRRDRRFCGKRCRQNAWKFSRAAVARERAAQPLRVAYADPPYPGKAHLYRDHRDYAGEVDHRALLQRLALYDGWALSTSSAALPRVCHLALELGLHPSVASWHRGPRVVPAAHPLHAWEPVLYVPARAWALDSGRIDTLEHVARPRYSDPDHVVGSKPSAFSHWVFALLGALPGDELHDLFPGSGGVARAWADYEEAATIRAPWVAPTP